MHGEQPSRPTSAKLRALIGEPVRAGTTKLNKDARRGHKNVASGKAISHDPMDLLGTRLRTHRQRHGLTLEALAVQTGFTRSYLSKLENGTKVPPIATLTRISHALGIELASFFRSSDRNSKTSQVRVSLVRAGERQATFRGGSSFGYDYQLLADTRVLQGIKPFIFTFPAQMLRDVFFEHEGEEMVFLLSGTLEFQIGERIYELSRGDCIYFDASIPHRGRGKYGKADALVVISDPIEKPAPRSKTERLPLACQKLKRAAARGRVHRRTSK